jgi:hypothetical protein
VTITSNIHVGLAGWSNATYTVGQRRSNGGNAYQVTTEGTSTSPPTGTGTGINNGGIAVWKWLSAVDYTTIQAWYTAIVTTLTQPVIGLVWNDGVITAIAGTAMLIMNGSKVTTSTNTITLKPAPGEGFQDKFAAAPTTAFAYNNANGVSIELPATGAGPTSYIEIDDNFVTLQGIQSKDLNSISASKMIGGSGTNLHIDQCIIEGFSQAGGASLIGTTASTWLTNCLIVDDVANNLIQNSSNVGAVAGSPGTPPTLPSPVGFDWQIFPSPPNATQTLAFGALADGRPYMDATFNGNPGGTFIQVLFGTSAAIASTAYVVSASVALIAGSLANVSAIGMNWDNYTGTPSSGGTFSSSGAYTPFTPNAILTRYNTTATSSGVCTVIYGSVFINVTSGLAVNFTLRIAGVQLEQGSVPTDVQITPASTAATLFSNGVFTVANNTFIRKSFKTSCAALSAGTNTTSATDVATNNIFYNYGLPFFAASGTPWSTNHNAYTAASFTGNSGTDTGGSVYGITGSATFTSPTTDFHLKSGASIQNAGATDTTDIPGAIDIFNVSRPQGASWDIGAHELLVGSVVFRDVTAAVGFSASVARSLGSLVGDGFSSGFSSGFATGQSSGVPIEWKLGKLFPAIFPIEWQGGFGGGGLSMDTAFSIDWKRTFPNIDNPFSPDFSSDFGPQNGPYNADTSFAIEWQSGVASIIGDARIPLEWHSTYSADQTAASEWSTSCMADGAAPIAWQRSHAVDAPAPVDWRASLVRDVAGSIDWAFPFVMSDSVLSVDWKASPVLDAVVSAEFGLSVIQTAVVPVETTSLRILGAAVPVDPGATGRLDAAIVYEWSSGLANGVTAPLETVLAVMRDVRILAETSLAVMSDAAMQSGYMLNLAQNVVLWIEPLIGIAADARAPLEFGGGATFGADAAVPVEWRSGIFQDGVMAAGGSVTLSADIVLTIGTSFPHVIDAQFGFVWAAGMVVDANVPAEWGHLTLSAVTDAAFPLEIKATIAADITAPIMKNIGRKAIGASLEPDEFEDKHEP